MNLMSGNSRSYFRHFSEIWNYRDLALQLALRDVRSKYKGSYLGIAWAILNPLLMLFVYSFIFIIVFKLKWNAEGNTGGRLMYTLMIFCGLIPYYIFSESVNRSLGLISGNANYVKKIAFPLEVLPISIVISSAISNGIGLVLLIIGKLLFLNTTSITILWLPFVSLPLIFCSLGVSLAFSALGAYVRDLTHTIALAMNILFYVSPIFYNVMSVPTPFRYIVEFNPLTSIINQWRNVFLLGEMPNYGGYVVSLLVSIAILGLGYTLFYFLRKGFADVI